MSGPVEMDLAWRMRDSAAAAIDKADTKAGFASTVETALAAVVLTLGSQSHTASIGKRVLFGLALVALAVALGSALLVLAPRLHRPADSLVPREFLYFGAVRLRSTEKLHHHIEPTPYREKAADPLDAVRQQGKRLTDIAWTKHIWLRVSFLAVTVGTSLASAAVLLGGGIR